MKKFEFVCKSAVKRFCIEIFVVGLPCTAICLLLGEFYLMFLALIFCFVQYLIYQNVLVQYKITNEFIENRWIKLKWNEIEGCEVFYPEMMQKNLKKKVYPPIICMGQIKQTDFFQQNLKKTVFIPVTQRNLRLIKEYYKGENSQIKAMIEQYLGYPEYQNSKISYIGR